MTIAADLVIVNASQVFTATGDGADPGIIEDGAVAVHGDRVAWVGPAKRLPTDVRMPPGDAVIDANRGVITPGLVDPHTHLVFAGSRPREFEWRLEGRPYLDILAAGGGILATVGSVRAATEDDLVEQAIPRLGRMLRFGVTTCEAKSGYGLDVENEMKMLRALERLSHAQPVRILPTLLGAHAFPPGFEDDREGYVDLVVREMIPEAAGAGLAVACDVFVDRGVFSVVQAERILRAALDAGLALHVHAGQFEDLGAPELAARLGALSADHLDVISDRGLEMMSSGGVTAVLLPGAAVSLGHEPPRADRFLASGVRVALATDLNPGTSYTENLPLMAFLGATRMGLGCARALLAVTREAARATGSAPPDGTVAPGALADLVVHGVQDWREILYHFGVAHATHVVVGGRLVLGGGGASGRPEPLQVIPESRSGHARQPGGGRDVAARPGDEPLDRLEARRQSLSRAGRRMRRRRQEIDVARMDRAAAGADGGSLQDVPELPHVPVPRVLLEERHRLPCDVGCASFPAIQQPACHGGDVPDPLAQRWHVNREDGQAVEQVQPEGAVPDP